MGPPWDNRGLPLLLLLFLCGVYMTEGYKPVVIVHGLFSNPKAYTTLANFITKIHPGTTVSVISLYNDKASLKPMWKQVLGFKRAIYPIMKRSPDGVHFICYSQGGLICRALLATIPDHNVHTFIALSSPLAGQYGDTSYLKKIFPETIRSSVFFICYSRIGLKISICNYWKDPHEIDIYLDETNFLNRLNGDKPHRQLKAWRKNFLRLKKLVLIGGPEDDVIVPWQSSLFGFYDSKETVVEMRDQDYYITDRFGLKTLDARGDLSMCVHSGVKHLSWHTNQTVFNLCIEKWLI